MVIRVPPPFSGGFFATRPNYLSADAYGASEQNRAFPGLCSYPAVLDFLLGLQYSSPHPSYAPFQSLHPPHPIHPP